MKKNVGLKTKANVAILQLVATLKGSGRVINSDWHAVTSDMECVSHLAFSSKNKYVTDPDYNWDCGSIQDPFTFATLYKDLYYDAYDPVEPDASVPVKFNGGPVDLEPLISIHTWHRPHPKPAADGGRGNLPGSALYTQGR